MNVGLLLLTQENIGGALLRAAQCQYEPPLGPVPTPGLEVPDSRFRQTCP